jgi:hypothetical protein
MAATLLAILRRAIMITITAPSVPNIAPFLSLEIMCATIFATFQRVHLMVVIAMHPTARSIGNFPIYLI